MNIPSNSRGNSTAESCPATVILTTVAIESLDLSVSRQPKAAAVRRADTPVRGAGVEKVEVNLVRMPFWTPEKMEPRVRAYLGF
ncbi:MAG TPA: hypothetical protein VK560_01650 [Gemmatimonadaceae bacterium]|nr:hypothetical protein [Gemmatimonadaceae bacterium]